MIFEKENNGYLNNVIKLTMIDKNLINDVDNDN